MERTRRFFLLIHLYPQETPTFTTSALFTFPKVGAKTQSCENQPCVTSQSAVRLGEISHFLHVPSFFPIVVSTYEEDEQAFLE